MNGEVNVGLMTLILFGSLIILLALGVPLVFAMGSLGAIGLVLVIGFRAIPIIYFKMGGVFRDFTYATIPLFIYMALMLDRAGIAEELYVAIQYWAGRLAGSLAVGTVLISTILAAMVGLSSASIMTMGVTVMPAMLRRGYDKNLAMGSIAAGSTLGILIPPSTLSLLYASQAGVSIGKMFIAGFLPGLLIAAIFIVYIGIVCHFKPSLGPPLPPEERVSLRRRVGSLKSVILPALLVVMVLGSIFKGIATPQESAAVGALGAILVVLINRKLTWKNLKEVNYNTMLLTLMIMWVLFAAGCFRALYVVTKAMYFIQDILMNMPFGRWGTLIAILILLIILGCFLDEFSILMVTMSIFVPVVRDLGFNLLWFGILFIINMQMATLTPPIGLNLFYMKAVAPDGTTMEDIYRAMIPFVLLLLFALLVVMLFPQIATWLPSKLMR